jgi:hypothetical protein
MTTLQSAKAPGAAGAWWSTSSFGDTPDTSAQELSTLGEHLAVCRACASRLFPIACGIEAMRRFVASRLVTSITLALLLIGAGLLLAPGG